MRLNLHDSKRYQAILRLRSWASTSRKHGCNTEPPSLEDVEAVLETIDAITGAMGKISNELKSAAEEICR